MPSGADELVYKKSLKNYVYDMRYGWKDVFKVEHNAPHMLHTNILRRGLTRHAEVDSSF